MSGGETLRSEFQVLRFICRRHLRDLPKRETHVKNALGESLDVAGWFRGGFRMVLEEDVVVSLVEMVGRIVGRTLSQGS